ncbi:DUF7009 family protein [Pedobacter sp. 22163]|uniref:DUF7009 family protein n=1 Tax=Pedobacter sp. 22163 TaxID=3453883 RepID=UPI003F86AC75
MKIRIKEQSIRFRLTQSDVRNLHAKGELEEHTDFLTGRFTYAIAESEVGNLSATFENGRITLQIPREMINELESTDRVGFSGNTGTLKLLIEKDFTCLDNTMEDQSDNYPNPLLA